MIRMTITSAVSALLIMTGFNSHAADDVAALSFKADTRALERMTIEPGQLPKLLRSVLLVTASSKPTSGDVRLGLAVRIAGPKGNVLMRQGKLKTTSADALMSGTMRAGEVLIINGIFDEPLRQVGFPQEARFVDVSYPGQDVFVPSDTRTWKQRNSGSPEACISDGKWAVSIWAFGEGLSIEKNCESCAVNLCFESAR